MGHGKHSRKQVPGPTGRMLLLLQPMLPNAVELTRISVCGVVIVVKMRLRPRR